MDLYTYRIIYTFEGVQRTLVKFDVKSKTVKFLSFGNSQTIIGLITHKSLEGMDGTVIYHMHISSDVSEIIGNFLTEIEAINITWNPTISLKEKISPGKKITGQLYIL